MRIVGISFVTIEVTIYRYRDVLYPTQLLEDNFKCTFGGRQIGIIPLYDLIEFLIWLRLYPINDVKNNFVLNLVLPALPT